MAIALTKIQPPRRRAGLIARPRLDAALAEAVASHAVVLVCAPAGFGKSALLSRWAGQRGEGTALAWVSADEDDDLARWAASTVAALEPLDLPWRTSPDALVAAIDGGRAARSAFVGELVNALLVCDAPRGVLLIDDAHRISDPLVFDALELLVERLPGTWSMVIGSRVDPRLPLARWRARGELAELRQEALRFDESEVRQLLAELPHDAAADDPLALLQRSDGWAAGLTLMIGAAARAKQLGNTATRRQLFDMLASEVLHGMPEGLREFLLRCSVLPELSPARCSAVAGAAATQQWLHEVAHRAPFVTVLDEAEPVLRLHDLFRDCLEELLRREQGAQVAALLERAAQAEADPVRRVATLLQAGALQAAQSTLIEQGQGMVAAGQGAAVIRLIEQFPAAAREASPQLAHLRGLCAWAHWDLVSTVAHLDRAASGFDAAGAATAAQRARVMQVIALTGGGQLAPAAALLAQVRSRPMDEHTEAIAWQAETWHLMMACRFDRIAEPVARMVEKLERSGDAALWLHTLPPSEMIGQPRVRPLLLRWAEGAMARTAPEPPTPLRALAQIVHAALAMWAGHLDDCAARLAQVASDVRWLNRPPNVATHLDTYLALCHAMRGDRDAALAAADSRLQGLTADERTSGRAEVWLNHFLYFKLRVAAALRDDELTRELAARIEANASDSEQPVFVRARMSLPARVAEAEQRWSDAAAGFEKACAPGASLDIYGQEAELRLRWTHALVRLSRLDDAAAALAPVFDPVARSGELGGVRLAGAQVLGALAQAPWGTRLSASQQQNLRLWAGGTPSPATAPAGPVAAAPQGFELLSPREQEVLRCIAAGDSNKLIARTFDLSPNTVKRHVSNILDKLALNSRGQAAAWFRQH